MVTASDGTVIGNSNGRYVTDSAGTILIDGLDSHMTWWSRGRPKDGYVLDDVPRASRSRVVRPSAWEFRNYPEGFPHHQEGRTSRGASGGFEFLVTTSDGTTISTNNGHRYTQTAPAVL
jgi:hypothetical protein